MQSGGLVHSETFETNPAPPPQGCALRNITGSLKAQMLLEHSPGSCTLYRLFNAQSNKNNTLQVAVLCISFVCTAGYQPA